MNPFTCLSPVKITNPYTGEKMFVPCCKCKACRTSKAANWVERLERERASHLFSIFFTLTYSDKYIKTAILHGDDYCSPDGEFLFNIKDKDSCVPLKDFTKEDWQYINKRRKIYYADESLIPKFIKRLRSKLFHYEKDLSKRHLRFYIVTEYGGTTLRPHHHGILFCDSLWFTENADRLINQAWSTDGRGTFSERYGLTDVQKQPVSCSSYVAGYLNSFVSIPKIYQCKYFRPKCHLSKRPPLGSQFVDKEEVQEIFDNLTPYHVVYRRKTNEFVRIPVQSYVENQLFPKLRGFDQISHLDRVELYSFLSRTKAFDYESFVDECQRLFEYNGTFKEVSFIIDGRLLYIPESTPSLLGSYIYLLAQHDSSLYRYYLSMRKVYQNMLLFGIKTIEEYVSKIEEYYHNKELYKLQEFYKMQERIKQISSCNLPLDPLFIERCFSNVNISDTNRLILKNYGYAISEITPDKLSYNTSPLFKSFASAVEARYNKSIKTKKRNDYKKTKETNFINSILNTIYG